MTSPESTGSASAALRRLRGLLGLAAGQGDWAFELLISLIPLVPRGLLSAIAALSADLPDTERAAVVEELVLRLAEADAGELLRQAVLSGRSIADEYRRASTLSHLALQLPSGMQSEIAEAAEELGDDFWRAKVLVNLPAEVSRARRSLAPEAWTAWARTVAGDEDSAAAIAGPGHSGGGPEAGVVRALLDAAAQSPDYQPAEVDAALRLTRSLLNPLARTLALADIADSRGGRAVMIGEALASARGISEPTGRVLGLARVASLLEPARREAVIEEAVATASGISDPAERASALLIAVPSVTAEDRPSVSEAALTAARSIASPALRSLRLADVSRIVADPRRQQVLSEALAAARAIPDRPDRALPLAHIAPYLPDRERPGVLAETLDESRTLVNLDRRTNVMTVLARNLSEQEAGTVKRRQVLSQQLRHALEQFGTEPARELMTESVRDWADAIGTSITLADPGLAEGVASAPAEVPRSAITGSRETRRPEARRERVVSTGFSSSETPDTPIQRSMPLGCQLTCYFWLEIGRPVPGAIDVAPEQLPDSVPATARLQVALFAYPGELEVDPRTAVGEVELQRDGSAVVLRQPAGDLATGSNLRRRRLFFPIVTPSRNGVARLRCNIYYHGLLVQSRLVRARIMRYPAPTDRALTTRVDYRLSRSLSPDHLRTLAPHRLSILLNNNGQGTHGLRVFGTDGTDVYRREATLDPSTVNTQRKLARNVLRQAAWGSQAPWTKNSPYRYEDGERNLPRLSADLISLAVKGSELWYALLDPLAESHEVTPYEEEDALKPLLREPAFLQLALKESPRSVFPVELIYDYRINSSPSELRLCEAFVAAFSENVPMAQTPCFIGHCPQAAPDADHTLVCPSGFWGYRHYLGIPFSLGGADDVPTELGYAQSPKIAVGVFREFKMVHQHWENLQKLAKGLTWDYSDTREETIKSLRQTQPQLVYLYCHGGTNLAIPYIRVENRSVAPITPANLFQERVSWNQSRSLVFMNGCETAGLQPEQAIQFVNFFVRTASASGMIGTQITVFEQLACDFAEECLSQFLVKRKTIGEAVREARLKLLQMGNPLGLVYLPFALASLRLAAEP